MQQRNTRFFSTVSSDLYQQAFIPNYEPSKSIFWVTREQLANLKRLSNSVATKDNSNKSLSDSGKPVVSKKTLQPTTSKSDSGTTTQVKLAR